MPQSIHTLLRSQWFFLLLVVVAISGVTAGVNPRYLTTSNIVSILEQISVLGLVAGGATILIVSGNFDISVGAAVGLASCVMAMLIKSDVSVFLADAPEQDAPDNSIDTLALAGIAGALILLAGMAVAYRGMRQTYVELLKAKAGGKS
jgi:ribose/xylose/arabinose/galactoside ABC-type transport system permease subunit